mgnify:CR=1 FL=1
MSIKLITRVSGSYLNALFNNYPLRRWWSWDPQRSSHDQPWCEPPGGATHWCSGGCDGGRTRGRLQHGVAGLPHQPGENAHPITVTQMDLKHKYKILDNYLNTGKVK